MPVKVDVRGLAELKKKLESLSKSVEDATHDWVAEVSAHAAERSKLLAPILTGDLRAETKPMDIVRSGDTVTGGVESDVNYAAAVSHLVQPAGYKGLGPISRLQPAQPEGPVGGAFIERAVFHHLETYEQELARRVEGALAGTKLGPGIASQQQ